MLARSERWECLNEFYLFCSGDRGKDPQRDEREGRELEVDHSDDMSRRGSASARNGDADEPIDGAKAAELSEMRYGSSERQTVRIGDLMMERSVVRPSFVTEKLWAERWP